jgi:hypothetical protein
MFVTLQAVHLPLRRANGDGYTSIKKKLIGCFFLIISRK